MKFNSGFWRLRDGVHALYPHHADEVVPSDERLTVYAPPGRWRTDATR
jgi:hypothetical protein